MSSSALFFWAFASSSASLRICEIRSLTSSCAGLPGERLLAHGGKLAAQVLGVVEGPGEPLLQFPDLVVAARYEVVNLAAAVAAHLHLELFVQQVRQEVTVFIHGITRILGPERSAGTMSGV